MDSREPDWDLYRSFLEVMAEGSLSGAARRLGLSQPTLGRHVAALEARLGGLTLFVRSQEGLAPTDAALGLEPFVRQMALASDALVRTATGEAAEARGVVRITASEIMGAEVLPPLLAEFRDQHPGVVVELVLANHTEDLLQREADIAVRMVAPTQNALVSRKLGSVSLSLYAHHRYAERHGLPTTLAELADHPLIGFDRRPSITRTVQGAGAPLTKELFAFRSDSDLAGLAALRAGFGLGMCQRPLAARSPELVKVEGDILKFELGIWLAMHEDLKGVRRMRLMFDHLANGLLDYIHS